MGVVCGYAGGAADAVLMRLSDLCLAFPGLVFCAGRRGGAGRRRGQCGAGAGGHQLAQVRPPARSQTLALRRSDFIAAARLAGSRPWQVAVRHLLPNILGPILVTAALDIGTMMMELAGLSFLGLGAQPPTAEWGSMMSDGRSMLQTYPWVVLAPGLAIFVTVALFNLLGDAVRDVLEGDGVKDFLMQPGIGPRRAAGGCGLPAPA